jgi:cytochrome c oxidase subunit 3
MPEVLSEIAEREEAVANISDRGGAPPEISAYGGDGEPWYPRRTPSGTYTLGMVVGMAASTMFFLALVSAAVVHRGMPGSDWVPMQPPSLLWVTSAIAILSSLTLVQARRMFKAGRERSFKQWWTITAVLGTSFLVGQVMAWRQLVAAGVYLVSNPSVSFFYVFTAAHGLHLLGGVVALVWIAYWQVRGRAGNTATKVAGLYWHFVTALWLFLFSFFLFGG